MANKELHDSMKKAKDKIGPKHSHIVDGLTQAIQNAQPQTEHGRLDAAVRTFTGYAGTMLDNGATADDFLNAIEAMHENKHVVAKMIKGEK